MALHWMLEKYKFECSGYSQSFLARLCEQAGRYDDMVTHVNEVASAGGELSFEEQNLLSTAYRNVVGTRRASLRIISSIEEVDSRSAKDATTIREYRHKILNELEKFCEDLLEALDERLIPIATAGMSKVFYYKMKGDYSRDLAEFGSGEKRSTAITSAKEAYNTATHVAQIELAATHPLRLDVALNFCVFYYEIQNSLDRACHHAEQAIDDAIAELGSLSEESFHHSTLVMQQLCDNLTTWRSSEQRRVAQESASHPVT
ncbi:14-3-3 domain-containing protein [Ilyonectria robusta]|uniref:14-3-3 domain-containing protein n=1 Tax=Ilyonectria robusta TaxID=1079257 RepID=UPI001E8E48F7|nr:14-3-3 domain-containing protein [Ilyonectria robusta]KAH8662783.1 14-3-3 domain-containing protein [Ilyonectria robusta]